MNKEPEIESRWFVDRIEEDWAVISTPDGEEFEIPVALLPEGVQGGWYLTCRLTRDSETEQAKQEDLAARRAKLEAPKPAGGFKL